MNQLHTTTKAVALMAAILATISTAHAQPRQRAEVDAQPQRRAKTTPHATTTATPTPTPIVPVLGTPPTVPSKTLPPGLSLNGRTLTWATVSCPTGGAFVTAEDPQGNPSLAQLWLESSASRKVATGVHIAFLPFDAAQAGDTSETVIVHDTFGSLVTFSTRHYGAQIGDTIELVVQVDQEGHLLPLPTVRLAWNHAKGVVTFTRDNDFDGALAVSYRVLSPGTPATDATVQTATIPAGAASVDVQEGTYGSAFVAYAGDEYSTAPSENSDVIQFNTK